MTKIDVFTHIFTKEFGKKLTTLAPAAGKTVEYNRASMTDLEVRERLMSRHPEVIQIVTMGNTPLERFVQTSDAVELAKIGNEELAELVTKRPDLFYSAAGMVPINDIDASIEIIDHCINDLNLLGIQLFTSIERDSLADPKYRPIFARIAEHDKTIWIHPAGTGYDRGMFSWPYESSLFMLDIVNAGIFEDYPELRIVIHHAGAMVPFFTERVRTIMPKHKEKYFKNFYVDTALYGNTPGLMCALDFYGVEHILFGTDAPMGAPHGANGNTSRTIMAIEKMSITEKEKEKIFQENAVDIFGRLL